MFEDLSNKPLFACWDELSLKNYIAYGTRSINDLIELQCSPETESQIFSESEKEFLSKAITRLSTDTHVFLSSKGSPAFAKNAFHKSKKTIDFQTIAESTHMFPIESPDDFSNRMLNCLD